jgi:hypothetical protein
MTAETYWDDRFARQVEIFQAGPKKPWHYYIPRGCGRPDRTSSINIDDIINLHQLLPLLDTSLDQFCESA